MRSIGGGGRSAGLGGKQQFVSGNDRQMTVEEPRSQHIIQPTLPTVLAELDSQSPTTVGQLDLVG